MMTSMGVILSDEAEQRPNVETKERRQHGRFTDVPTEDAGVYARKASIECVLDRYLERAQLVDRQHEAGMRLRSLWRAASLPCAVTAPYGEKRGAGGGMERNVAARRQLKEVLVSSGLANSSTGSEATIIVITPDRTHLGPADMPLKLRAHGHVAVAVCGFDEWAGGTRRLMQLREALTDLADYWELPR